MSMLFTHSRMSFVHSTAILKINHKKREVPIGNFARLRFLKKIKDVRYFFFFFIDSVNKCKIKSVSSALYRCLAPATQEIAVSLFSYPLSSSLFRNSYSPLLPLPGKLSLTNISLRQNKKGLEPV